ncbi:exp1-like protein [Linnemannia zychae]|nr:exp1-like protein [Linnemannia zychae]
MFSLSAFRAALTISAAQPVRAMSVKTAAASAATKRSSKKESTSKSKSTATTKSKTAKNTGSSATKAKKATPVKAPKVATLPMPKRPITAWGLFYVEHLERVKASGKSIVPTTETAIAAAKWKELSEAQQQVYKDKYKTSFEEYKEILNKRMEELTPEEIRVENARRQALRAAGKRAMPKLKDPNAPKRPLSSYFLFAQEQRQSGKYNNLPVKEQAKTIASQWKKLSDHEKTQYVEAANKAAEAYKAKRAAYLEGSN